MAPKVLIGLDLGGTSVKAGLVTNEGETLDHDIFPLPGRSPKDVFSVFFKAIDTLLARQNLTKEDVIAVGVCCPGLADIPNGIVSNVANFPTWNDVDVCTPVRNYVGKSVFLENDATAAACGEWWHLTTHPELTHIDNMCMLTLGTGVGCGIIADGRVIYGRGMAGEYGHVIIDHSEDALLCGCGQRGCLERYVSAEGIVLGARTRAMRDTGNVAYADSALLQRFEREEAVSCKDIFDAARGDDSFAISVVDHVAKLLAIACINLCRVFDTEAILLGGGVADAGAVLLDRVNRYYKEMTWRFQRHDVIIMQAQLHNDAGFKGAAKVAKDRLGQ